MGLDRRTLIHRDSREERYTCGMAGEVADCVIAVLPCCTSVL
jgi:hypothetical protein